MRIIFLSLIYGSIALSMHDPQNMSREMLEKAFNKLKMENAQQKEIIECQTTLLHLFHTLHHGTYLEKLVAQSQLNKYNRAYVQRRNQAEQALRHIPGALNYPPK